MAKKNWIFLKRGLTEDAKHRERMGIFVWLFLHMVDRADWEEGVIFDWRDAEEADDMSMPVVTLRYQRRKLEELGYITSRKRQSKQEITIHNWVNPRTYGGKVTNRRSVNELTPSELESDNQSDNQSDNRSYVAVNTPTSSSITINHSSPQKEKKPKPEKAGVHPAISAFREKAQAYPAKGQFSTIETIIGDVPENLERWGKTVEAWILVGWSPRNVAGMLDFFKRRELPGNRKPNGNGRASTQDEKIAELERFANG